MQWKVKHLRSFGSRSMAALLFAASCSAAIRIPRGESAWIVANPATDLDRRALTALTEYISKVVGKAPAVVQHLRDIPSRGAALVLVDTGVQGTVRCQPPGGSPEAFCIAAGRDAGRSVIVLRGATDRGLKRAVQRAVIQSRQLDGDLEFPGVSTAERPWIRAREWAICPWVPQHVRGVFVNPYADNRLNIWLFGDRQLARYVDMFDWFGFSGVQLIETSYRASAAGPGATSRKPWASRPASPCGNWGERAKSP